MPRRLAAAVSLALLTGSLLMWLAAVPIVSAGDPCYHDYVLPNETSASTQEVKLLPCAFAPTVTKVEVGSTVTFVNVTDFTHLVTGANQAWGSRDAELAPGATVHYRFDQAGIYPYACALHRGMSGTIIVGDTSAAAPVAPVAPAAAAAGSGTGTRAAPTAEPAAQVGMGDGPLVVLAVLSGAVLGGLVVGLATRRAAGRRTGSASSVA